MTLVRTVGHGTLDAADFVALLHRAGITAVADVRRYPGSRRYPHFSRPVLERSLAGAGIEYRWIEALGGRRKPVDGSRHTALRNQQFQAYADHMSTAEFVRGLAALQELTVRRSAAVLCAESLWWRCHRRLLADELVLLEGETVEHLLHDGRLVPHEPTPGVRVVDGALIYDQNSSQA